MTLLHPQARSEKLLVKQIGDETVVYDQRSLQIRRLNRTAAAVWRNCNGRRSVAELVVLARVELAAPKLPARVVEQALERLEKTALLREVPSRLAPPSRRSARGRGLASAHAAVIASMLAPTPAMTASGAACGSPCTSNDDCLSATDGCNTCSNSVGKADQRILFGQPVAVDFVCVNNPT